MRHFPKLPFAFLTAAFLAAAPLAAVAQQTGIPISQLPRAALPLTGTETVPLVQNGFTRQAPASSLLAISVPPRPTTLGGVFQSSAPAGEYAIGVDQNGNILYSALIGNLAGHASGDLAIANNLSDLANVTTARKKTGH